MDYHLLESVPEFEAAHALEIAIWGLGQGDAVPVSMLRAIQHGGGSLIGAYDGERLVGISLAFPARIRDRWVLWSHMTGVDRAYQGQSIGFELKRRQHTWALASGFDEIRWTFDPLQRGNANFNVSRLGAIVEHYYVDFYGVMADGINAGAIPSDRVEAVWRLRDSRVEQRMNGSPDIEAAADVPFLLRDNAGIPQNGALDPAQREYLVQIPRALPADLAEQLQWRLALRCALQTAFDHGYTAVDYIGANAYLLRCL